MNNFKIDKSYEIVFVFRNMKKNKNGLEYLNEMQVRSKWKSSRKIFKWTPCIIEGR